MTRRSLAVPFRRAARDLSVADDDALLRAQVEEVLGTECNPDGTGGELPWRTSFGTPLHLLRHRAGSDVTRELSRVWIRDALAKWVPRARVAAVDIEVASSTLTIRVRFTSASGTHLAATKTVPLAP